MVECNICGWRGDEFHPLRSPGFSSEDRNVFCPGCGSYERHRAITYYLNKTAILPRHGLVLEIGNGLIRAFRKHFEDQGMTYFNLDPWPNFSEITGDVTDVPFRTCSFEIVVCSHVLEHIPDDFRAMCEILRIVKPAGWVLFQVPYDDNRFNTIERDTPPTKQLGSGYHYGHIRDYGLDILERLSFFWKSVIEIHPLLVVTETEARRYGFEKNYGTTFFCSNSASNCDYPGRLSRALMGMKRHWMTQRRAYEIFLDDGNSDPLAHWLRAESEVGLLSDEKIRACNVFDILRCKRRSGQELTDLSIEKKLTRGCVGSRKAD